jgi:hypothetical protein
VGMKAGGLIGSLEGSLPLGSFKSCVSSCRTQDGSEFLLQAKDEVRSGPFTHYVTFKMTLSQSDGAIEGKHRGQS